MCGCKEFIVLRGTVAEDGDVIVLKYYLTSINNSLTDSDNKYGICVEKYEYPDDELLFIEESSVTCDDFSKELVCSIIDEIAEGKVTPITLKYIIEDKIHEFSKR